MIIGGHSIIYSTAPEADRAFLRDVLRFPSVDVGEGWLIFGLPPTELAIHPSDSNDIHEFFLMCENAEAFVAEMQRQGVPCEPIKDQGYGLVTQVKLPGGGRLGVYEPRHARPPAMAAAPAVRRAKPAAKKPVKRAVKKTVKKPKRR